jgi:hypothetical protein
MTFKKPKKSKSSSRKLSVPKLVKDDSKCCGGHSSSKALIIEKPIKQKSSSRSSKQSIS